MLKPATYLRRFAFDEKFSLIYDNALAFTGKFIDGSTGNVLGKQLFIALSEKHPALTFIITSTTFFKPGLESIIVHFPSAAERQIVAAHDFSDEIFLVEK